MEAASLKFLGLPLLRGKPLVAGVQPRFEFPCLTAGLSVSQQLEQRDDADPEVECDAGLQSAIE